MSTLASVFGYGLLSARPAAAVAGRFYYATDTSFMYRDNGSTWDTLAIGVGAVAADTIWDAKGDLAVGTGANTAAKLTVGANDTIPMADSGETTGIKWVASATPSTQALGDAAAVGTADTFTRGDHKHAMPAASSIAGYELDYVQITSPVTITGTTGAGATTVVTGSSVAYDGSTIVLIEFYADYAYVQGIATTGPFIQFVLYDGSTQLGNMGLVVNPAAGVNDDMYVPISRLARRLTPSNASHTYSIRAYKVSSGTVQVDAGTGASGASMPAFIRITKAA